MTNFYDVVIVGAGPAGLRAAEILKDTDLKVLLLEKKSVVGPKVCAAGLTRKSLELMDVPEKLFEIQISKSALVASKNVHYGHLPEPVVFMIDRKDFGQWQLSKLKNAKNITIRTSAQVTKIENSTIEINRKEKVQYKYLIGADGANSVVRRYLKIPLKKVLASLQYKVPVNGKIDRDKVQIIVISKYFNNGYAWIFPHKSHIDVGCAADPKMYPVKKLKEGFKKWLDENNIDVSNAKYESFPISYDYRGYRFGNVFLAGEAAGLASGLTGEGIYQALVSGEEVAKLIMNPDYIPEKMEKILRYNRIQNKVLKTLKYLGPAREVVFNLFIKIIKKKSKKTALSEKFS